MTRPPDFDLTTVEGIVRTVEAMTFASGHARSWTQAGTCHPGTSNDNPCRQPACINRAVRYSHEWATEAAHHARRLQGVAALVSVSGDLAAWQEWRERGKA